LVHAPENWYFGVDVVVDANVALGGVGATKATGVLRDGSLPSDRHRQQQRVESRVIEAFADVAAGGEYDARLIVRELG
jgi:hypothetical protein